MFFEIMFTRVYRLLQVTVRVTRHLVNNVQMCTAPIPQSLMRSFVKPFMRTVTFLKTTVTRIVHSNHL